MITDIDFTRLTEFLEKYPKRYDIPFYGLTIHKNGKEIYKKKFGFLDKAKSLPIQGNERYYMYSCSKIVTCVAALTLMEKGKYHLDDAVSLFLPEFGNMTVKTPAESVKANSPVTVKNLFTMTSGMDYDYNAPEIRSAIEQNKNITTAEMIRVLAKRPLAAQPGERFLYGFSHDVLARLVEVWSGMRFSDYVEETIFKPLEMAHSTFNFKEAQSFIAPLYKYNYETRQPELYKNGNYYIFSNEYESGGAGLISTPDDYLKFLDGLISGKILSKYTLQMMTTNQLNDEQMVEAKNSWVFRGFGYGLGVKVHTDKSTSDNNVPLGVFGWSGAAGSMPIADIKNGLTIFYEQHMLYDHQGEFESRLLNVIYSCLGDEVQL